jgi:NADH:ubiquinone oxidoreductase subunit 2 (subunit N)
MWLGEPVSEEKVPSSGALRLALALSILGVLFLGVLPGFVMRLAEMAAQMFAF